MLALGGEDRVRMVNVKVSGLSETLKSLEKVAEKHEILGSSSKRGQIWAKFRWSVGLSKIDAIRNKVSG